MGFLVPGPASRSVVNAGIYNPQRKKKTMCDSNQKRNKVSVYCCCKQILLVLPILKWRCRRNILWENLATYTDLHRIMFRNMSSHNKFFIHYDSKISGWWRIIMGSFDQDWAICYFASLSPFLIQFISIYNQIIFSRYKSLNVHP